MSLDPTSGLPGPGMPSIHGAESVHAVHHRPFPLGRSAHRHVHVCDDPDCVAGSGSSAAALAVGIVGFLLVALLALYGFSQVDAGPQFPGGPPDTTDATCTSGGVPVDCPPFP